MATIGEQFATAREAKGVSQAQAANDTKIMGKVITALEEDDFASMAAPTYARGFIKLYSKYLELDAEPLLEEYNKTYGAAPRPFLDGSRQLNQSTNIVTKPAIPNIKLPAWLKQLEKIPLGPFKDIRVAAGAIAGLLVLIVLIGSISTCARKQEPTQTESTPIPRPEVAPPPTLLDEPLPDLYQTGPETIETN